ncbi:MAG: hypothetical protein ACK56F_13455, partial [bacterium]
MRFSELLRVRVVFEDSSGTATEGGIEFYILPSLSVTAIVGLPEIVRFFLPLFVDMLQSAADFLFDLEEKKAPMLNSIDGLPLSRPWEQIEDEAPEEDDVVLPCAFPDYLHYM